MFDLTRQEKQASLFLISVILLGLGIDFVVKTNSRVGRVLKTGAHTAKLDINKVSLDELAASQCLSPKLAKSIIEYRNNYGLFRGLQDLKEIKGIGDYRFEKLKDLFFVE